MATGTGLGYSRKVVWGKSCEPQSTEPDSVYVFDAKEDAPSLPLIRKWLEALPNSVAPPLVAVIAPKLDDELSLEESEAFQSAIEPLWAYPLDRPAGDTDLLTYVRRLLPDLAPIATTAPPAPFAAVPEADSSAAFDQAAARLLRRVPLHDRFD